MISLKSKIVQRLLGYFFLHEDAVLYVNEMVRVLKVDRGNLIRKLRSLEKEGLLISEFRGNQKYFSLDKKYPLLKEYKRIILKTIGFEKKLKDLLKNVEGAEEAYVFGSYAEDKMDLSSDIDLLVVGRQGTIELQRKISKLQQQINREINVVSIGKAELEKKEKTDPFIKRILKKKKIRII